MTDTRERMIEAGKPPTSSQIKSWVGVEAYDQWKHIVKLIDRKYPIPFPFPAGCTDREHGKSFGVIFDLPLPMIFLQNFQSKVNNHKTCYSKT